MVTSSKGGLAAQVRALRKALASEKAARGKLERELSGALAQQSATAEILEVIRRSPADTQPVFDAIARCAAPLFSPCDVSIHMIEGERIALRAATGPRFARKRIDKLAPLYPLSVAPEAGSLARVIAGKQVAEVRDTEAPGVNPRVAKIARAGKFRWILSMPLLREDEGIGAISLSHPRPRFKLSAGQRSLLQTFAAQAAVAIENVRLFNETKEALERQTATAEILKVISRSPTDIQPVLDAVAEYAARLCGATDAIIRRVDPDGIRLVAHYGPVPITVSVHPVSPGSVGGRAVLECRTVHVHDILDPHACAEYPDAPALRRDFGIRTIVAVPLRREKKAIGVIVIRRRAARAFTDKQIALLETFADQAAIAIENVRLFNETSEALERQTATAEILKVISSSPTDLRPVFDAILENATRLCDAHLGILNLHEAGRFRTVAQRGAGPEYARWLFERGAFDPEHALVRMMAERQPVQVADLSDTQAYRDGKPITVKLVDVAKARTFLVVPLQLKGEVIGNVAVYRPEVRPFSDKQIDLVATFADQAVIAIENVRLFNETREALERQTATAEILKVIAGSPSEVQPVFDAIANAAMRLVGGFSAAVTRVVEGKLHLAAFTSTSPAGDEALIKSFPRPIGDGLGEGLSGPAIRSGRPFIRRDTETDPDVTPEGRERARARGYRSGLAVPLVHEGTAIGTINVSRREPGGFSKHQVDLLQTFADQAVIAIENARLFNETKEALERQTATAEILRVISGTPADTQPVFDAIVQSALRIFNGQGVGILLAEGDRLQLGSAGGIIDVAEARSRYPLPLDRNTVSGQAILEKSVVNIADCQAEATPAAARRLGRDLGYRAIAAAPMLREGVAVGAITVVRKTADSLSDKEIALLKTFADQAVIAIQNARLFNETKEALAQQTATAEILRVIGSSMTDAQPVFEAIVNNCHTLFKGSGVILRLVQDGRLQLRASSGETLESMPIDRESAAGACVLDSRMIHLPDLEAATAEFPRIRHLGLKMGYRSGMYAPLLRSGAAIGTIAVLRPKPGAFDDKELALLHTFADQAVIAIENVRLFNETKEALERQTATSEVLRVISQSQSDTRPVFDAIIRSAVALCNGTYGSMARVDGETMHLWAHYNYTAEALKLVSSRYPAPISENSLVGLAVRTGEVMHSPDLLNDLRARKTPYTEALGIRAQLTVPLRRDGKVIGTLNVLRREPGRFAEEQVTLLKTFAAQAVIAIENVRLFNETKEALERQTATAEILRVIASSPSDMQPVFDAIAQSATRLLGGFSSAVARVVDDALHLAAFTSTSSEGDEALERSYPRPLAPASGVLAATVCSGAPVVVGDIETGGDFSPTLRERARKMGYRSIVAVPMLRDKAAIGSISVTRREPGPFTDHQIGLLKTFADQAVIAIENVRLFNETKEALERQTATAEILKVISSSPTDMRPVFETIARNAVRLCGSLYALVFRFDGGLMHLAGSHHVAPDQVDALKVGYPRIPDKSRAAGRAILSNAVVRIEDTRADLDYDSPAVVAANWRRILAVPLLREGKPLGAITAGWTDPGPIPKVHEDLLRTFADQAVIAIENVRLFKELQSRTEALTKSVGQLTALGEVGQAISSTLDLETVLKTIVSRAVQLTGLDGGSIYEFDEQAKDFRVRAAENMDEELLEVYRRMPIRVGEGIVGNTALSREPVQVPDIQDESYQSRYRELLIRQGYRAILAVPLLREEHIVGALTVNRRTPGPFARETIDLLKTFATQSALAIQNARLFREIAEKGRQLEVASQHKSQFLASMSHELRTPLNALLGFNEMILGNIYGEVPADIQPPLAQMRTSGKHLLRLINNVLDLAKIEAGRMELALSDYSVNDTLESVRSTLRPLAADKGLELLVSVPEDLPLAYGDPGRVTQCLMNLAGNSVKFTKIGKVEISVALNDGQLRFSVADTGIGIPPEKLGSLFTEFKQTDATIASEYGGTGLGLAISKKFVEMHGGRIWVESEAGRGSTFIFEIPLRAGEGRAA